MRKPILSPVIISVLLVGALTVSDPSVRAASDTPRSSVLSPNPSSTTNELRSVSAVSPTEAWAVGWYADDATGASRTLILHWDGTGWSQTPSPNPGSTGNELSGVSARSATDVWAVGSYADPPRESRTLILHWDGTSWSHVTSPKRGVFGGLLGVDTRSANDAWAVGIGYPTARRNFSLILQWDGTRWSRVGTPVGKALRRVSASSATDAWTVGVRSAQFLHWDGTRWSGVESHSPRTNHVWGVSTQSATDAWAVGSYFNAANHTETLILHWDGIRWSQVDTPTPGRFLTGVSSTRARNAWAVGTSGGYVRQTKTLIYHWDGTRWSKVESPSPSSSSNDLLDVSASSTTNAWAVGSYFDEVADAESVLILHWDGTTWVQE